MATRKIEARNGTRHPQAWKLSGDNDRYTMRMMISDTSKPRVAVVWMKLV